MVKKTDTTLPREKKDKKPFRQFHLEIPISLWGEMMHFGLKWGQTTSFILDAIREKMQRAKANADLLNALIRLHDTVLTVEVIVMQYAGKNDLPEALKEAREIIAKIKKGD